MVMVSDHKQEVFYSNDNIVYWMEKGTFIGQEMKSRRIGQSHQK